MENIFDYAASKELAKIGMEKARYSTLCSDDWVKKARSIAIGLATKNGEVTINDVYKICPRPKDVHPNASGSVLKCQELIQIGTTQSDKISRRTGIIRIYGLRN